MGSAHKPVLSAVDPWVARQNGGFAPFCRCTSSDHSMQQTPAPQSVFGEATCWRSGSASRSLLLLVLEFHTGCNAVCRSAALATVSNHWRSWLPVLLFSAAAFSSSCNQCTADLHHALTSHLAAPATLPTSTQAACNGQYSAACAPHHTAKVDVAEVLHTLADALYALALPVLSYPHWPALAVPLPGCCSGQKQQAALTCLHCPVCPADLHMLWPGKSAAS